MSDSQPASANRAVFLSYASQDAEAAKRICEALRAAGVEVWFDQNELVGGDAWDAKIRKQIADCALFVPMVSAATQARHEGYFRLEWKLAAQRTHMMSGVRAFLLPVVIDGTRDAEAHVPEEFRAVQWTSLPAGETTPAFCARVKKLLGGEGAPVGPVADRAPHQQGDLKSRRRSSNSWLVPALLVGAAAAVALALWQPWHGKEKSTPSTATTLAPPALSQPNGLTEAQQLVAKARKIFDEGDEMNHENYFLADDLLKKAVTLDSTDGEVWAAQAELSAEMVMSSYDRSAARQQNLRMQAERAVKLAPDSTEAQLAYAYYLTVASFLTPNGEHFASEAVATVQKLNLTAAQQHRGGRVRLSCMVVLGKLDEWKAAVERANAPERNDPRVLGIAATQFLFAGRYADAEDFNARSMALRRSGRTQIVDALLKLVWRGDLDGAASRLAEWPSWLSLEDRGVFVTSQVWMWRHEPDKALAALSPVSRDFLNDSLFVGPKAVLVALAQEMAGNTQAARAAWEDAKRVAIRVASEQTADQRALVWKAVAMARLGETTEAEAIFRQLEQSKILRSEFWSCTAPSALLRIALGHGAEVAAQFDSELRSNSVRTPAPSPQAALRLNPVFDSIRATPEFQKWMAAAPAPKANDVSASASAGAVVLDPKSVAVLAFANMSAEKDNEYFSDGLSENILDKLARNPGLRVMARTSSFSYKGKNVPVQQIAQELHVGTVIEGSVQRAGNKLRVVAQLINATDGMHLWSETYDRELTTTDIFALQDEIALKIAAKLAPSSAATPVAVAAAPTKNLEAYEAYLRGREQQVTSVAPFYQLKAAEFFEKATQLDPTFALAWVQLARVHSGLHYIGGVDDEDRELMFARTAIDQAQRLQPDLPAIHLALACLRAYGEHDYSSARRELDLLARSQPDDADTCQLRGLIARTLLQFSVAIEFFQRGLALDPKNSTSLNSFGLALMSAGRYAEAESVLTQAAQVDQSTLPLSNRARVLLRWKGDAKLAFASLEQVRIDRLTGSGFKNVVWLCRAAGEHAKALEYIRQANWSFVLSQWEYVIRDLLSAQTKEAMGDSEGARRDYLAALSIAERTREAHRESQRAYLALSEVYAGLGRREDALGAVRKSLELMPPAQDPYAASFQSLRVMVDIEGRFGLIDDALEVVRQQIAAGLWTRNDLLLSPDFIHLQKAPRFRALAEKAPL